MRLVKLKAQTAIMFSGFCNICALFTYFRKEKEVIKEIKKELSKGYTENGDISHSSTLNANLDFFGKAGSLRYDEEEAIELFLKAYVEDRETALKNLLYLRDIRDGNGERNLFRVIFLSLLDNFMDDEAAKNIIDYLPNIGRWDDVIYMLNTKDKEIKSYILTVIKARLLQDMYLYSESKPVSLLAKWMPSINASSSETKKMALYLSRELFGGNNAEYRKTLSTLRRHIGIIETNLTIKDYSFDYNGVPGKALMKYVGAFYRNDEERYKKFLENLRNDNKKIQEKAEKLMPYEIVRLIEKDETLANSMWDSLDKTPYKGKAIIVRDGSGSMTMGYGSVSPLQVADALSIYMSERTEGELKNKFITFSAKPELVELGNEMTLSEKVHILSQYDDCFNTNVEKLYDLVYEVNKSLEEDERIESLIIVSDMQFDSGLENPNESTFGAFKRKFEEANMELPKIVFWNVGAYGNVFSSQELSLVQYVSGFSKNVFGKIVEGKEIDAVELMLEALGKYEGVFENKEEEWDY